MEYGSVTSSVFDEGVQYRTVQTARGGGIVGDNIYLGKIIFYRQPYYNLDFILSWLYPYV